MAPIGKESKDLTINELQEVCTKLSLNIEGMTTKKEVLKVVQAWEKKAAAELADSKEALGVDSEPASTDLNEADLHDGKIIISKTPKTVNGVEYNEILVEGGVTFLAKK